MLGRGRRCVRSFPGHVLDLRNTCTLPACLYFIYRKMHGVQGMSWTQREDVLRLLFDRLSDATAAAYFAELPQHSFPVAEEPAPLRGLTSEAGPASLA